MLTGDKGLTARQIGISCGLISQQVEQNLLVVDDTVEPEALLESLKAQEEKSKAQPDSQLMISGQSMTKALEDSSCKQIAIQLVMQAPSVILYRSSPAQKAEMVKLIKREAKG